MNIPKDNMVLYLFKKDLRVADNHALYAACKNPLVFLVYIIDEEECPEAAWNWWRYHSIHKLQQSLGNRIAIFQGKTINVIENLLKNYPINQIYVNKLYNKHDLPEQILGVKVLSFIGNVLIEPEKLYQVFTPFYKFFATKIIPDSLPPATGNFFHDSSLNYEMPMLANNKSFDYIVGEAQALLVMQEFLQVHYHNYKEKRDFLGINACSLLSPYLAHGEISPRTIYHATDKDSAFIRQLVWREFAYHFFYFVPEIEYNNFQKQFDTFPWQDNETLLHAWKFGNTGVPIVDAAQKQLLLTGYVHNRTRMIAASFLTKNLRIHWSAGERWYRENLVDVDLASNLVNWQWVAGTGTDAAPYFRIFNPRIQMEKFDPECLYIKTYLPDFSNLSAQEIFDGVRPDNYPAPIVDLKASREESLSLYSLNKKAYSVK